MYRIASLLLVLLFSCPWNGWALDLRTAKAQGLVGETPTGYLAAVGPASAEAEQLIRKINEQRRKEYQALAQRNNVALGSVEQLAGKQAMEKTPSGQYIHLNGAWVKK
ncbi:MAG: YdbL family protein [Desulfobulbus sp.]|jgi:uncharacterized protein YdbL (DUF1318 family)